MKISYVLQLKDFLLMLLIGLLLGIFYGLLNVPTRIKPNIIFQIFIDLIFCAVAFALFLILINTINLGEFRLFLFVGYMLGFYLERISIGKLFAKGFKKVYTCLVNILKKFANSKFGRILFK